MKHIDWYPEQPRKGGNWESPKPTEINHDFDHIKEGNHNNFHVVESETEKCYVPGGT